MEDWQKLHIQKHLIELLENTICTTQLITQLQSVNVIGRADNEQIDAIPVSSAKSKCLYDILQTRTNSYLYLLEALSKCKQTGAHKILLEGVLQYGFLKMKVKIGDHIIPLETLIDETTADELRSALKNFSNEETLAYSFLNAQTSEKPLQLVKDTLPSKHPVYISRTLTKRTIIPPNVFHNDSSDVFVFKGVERPTLTRLASPFPTKTSSKQLQNVTERFIHLENDADWEEIQKNSKDPVHLIKYEAEDDNFILLESSGTTNIFQHITCNSSKACHCPTTAEGKLLDILTRSDSPRGICICDTPGMGKSELIANLAQQLSLSSPKQISAYIPLRKFLGSVEGSLDVPFQKSDMLPYIVKYISPSSISQEILAMLIEKNHVNLILCFDGFDEILKESISWTRSFLKTIIEFPAKIKVVATGRPQMRNELEGTLCAKAYELLPFSRKDQTDFLVNLWKHVFPSTHTESRLRDFAEVCIENMHKTLQNQDHDILGIPLQCYLLAGALKDSARIFSTAGRRMSTESIKTANSLFAMYRSFIDSRLENEMTKSIHVWKALILLFPEIADEYAYLNEICPGCINEEELLSLGILEARYAGSTLTTEFVHRTFAEYLVAEFLTVVLSGKDVNQISDDFRKRIIKFTVDKCLAAYRKGWYSVSSRWYNPSELHNKSKSPTLFYSFTYSMTAYFLNEHMQIFRIYPVDQLVADYIFPETEADQLYKLLVCSLRKGYSHILHFVKLLLTMTKREMMQGYSDYFQQNVPDLASTDLIQRCTVLLCIAAEYSNLKTVKEFFTLSRECFQLDVLNICKSMPLWMETPLHHAVDRGDYELVEFLVDKFSLERKPMSALLLQRRQLLGIPRCDK